MKNGWAGILVVVYGCIRDSQAIGEMDLFGVFALGTHPKKTVRSSATSAGRRPGDASAASPSSPAITWLTPTEDGVVVSRSV